MDSNHYKVIQSHSGHRLEAPGWWRCHVRKGPMCQHGTSAFVRGSERPCNWRSVRIRAGRGGSRRRLDGKEVPLAGHSRLWTKNFGVALLARPLRVNGCLSRLIGCNPRQDSSSSREGLALADLRLRPRIYGRRWLGFRSLRG